MQLYHHSNLSATLFGALLSVERYSADLLDVLSIKTISSINLGQACEVIGAI